MIIIIILFWVIFFYSLFARLLRWLSIWQQKEYRFDRLTAFLKTSEGKKELQKIVILPTKKIDIKRPVWTKKVILIFVISLLVLGLFNWNNWLSIAAAYALIPLIVIVSSLPTTLITFLFLKYFEFKAVNKINQFKPEIIGISGSYGKTTTKILLKHLLSGSKKVWMSPKSHNTPLSIATAIAKTYRGEEIVILEYASYKKGEINYVANLYPPNFAIFTGINNQHLALFGSWEQMLQAETELFESLKPGSVLFYNDSDSEVSKEVKKFKHLKLIPAANLFIKNFKLDDNGYLTILSKDKHVKTKLLGSHYLINLSQAVNVARFLKIPDEIIIDKLENFKPTQEFIRLKKIENNCKLLIDDRTSNVDGVLAAIDLSKTIIASQKILITGGIVDLGEESSETHQRIAKRAKKVFDQIWYTTSIEGEAFIKEFGDKFYSITNIDQLIVYIEKTRKANTLFVIEGKLPKDIDNYLKLQL